MKVQYKTILLIVWALLFLNACSNQFNQKLFVQQQTRASKDGAASGGTVGGWEEEESDLTDSENGGFGGGDGSSWSMFAVLQKDGEIKEALFGSDAQSAIDALKAKLAGGSDSIGKYSSSQFENWQIRSTFSGSNVPNFWFEQGNPWVVSNAATNESRFKGPNSSAGSNSISDMVYIRYKGMNPLFAPESSYNKAEYAKSDPSSSKERIMERFEFYRFTGKGGGVAALDNMLAAFDTYTKLVFAFAKPTKFESLLGNQVPKEWGPVDLVSTGPGGKKYKFYEYDPAGYVSSEGKVVLYDWYVKAMSNGSYDPVFTGISPYLGTAGGASGGGGAGGIGGGYAVTGVLTVKAKSIYNESMTDSWGDHGNADSADSPEFIYDIRSRSYQGFELPEWDSLSSYKPNDTTIMPAAALFIRKGETRMLGGIKQYLFEKSTKDLTLELDSRIVEIDIKGNDWVTDYEMPIVYLSYDRNSQSWKPTIDNKTFFNGPVIYDKNFTVRAGEEPKEFVVTLPAGAGQNLQLCYELQWQSVANAGSGRIVSAEVINNTKTEQDSLFDFTSSEAGSYILEYTDFSQSSANTKKQVELILRLGNMEDATKAVTLTPNSTGFPIQNILLNGEKRMSQSCYNGKSEITVGFEIESYPTQDTNAVLKLQLSYASGGYDISNSPKEITVVIKRNRYLPPKKGQFKISNAVLKNNSLMDVAGDAGDVDGYGDPEFHWNIRTRFNNQDWIEFSRWNDNPNTAKRISVGKELNLSTAGNNGNGMVLYTLDNNLSGIQRIYIDTQITEIDRLAGNDNDIISKFGEPLFCFQYNTILNEWNYKSASYSYFSDASGNKWELKKVTVPTVKFDQKQKIVFVFSSYIADKIWPAGNIADFIAGQKPAGWGDMELSFDIEWENIN